MGRILTSIDEIQAFNTEFMKITEGLPIQTGSVLRVPSRAYGRWGIEITDENVDWLRTNSGIYYPRSEANLYAGQESDKTAQMPIGYYERMIHEIGLIVKEIFKSLDDNSRIFRICNLGGKHGPISSSILSEIQEDKETKGMLQRIEFYLVDEKSGKLENAGKAIEQYGAKYSKELKRDEKYLQEVIGNERLYFDLVVSFVRFHHKPFPDHLNIIKEVLANDGALVIGDTYSALWDHPINAYNLLQRIGASTNILDAFRSIFTNINPDLMRPDEKVRLEPDEVSALEEHMKCWIEIMSDLRSRPTGPICFLEAHQTSRARKNDLDKAGFETDAEKIRIAFPKSRISGLVNSTIVRSSDFARVSVYPIARRRGDG